MKKRASGAEEKVAKVKGKQPVPAPDDKAEKHRMNRELLLLVDALAREKNVPKDIVFMALESALASATKKRFTQDIDARVSIDRETGDYESFRRWTVVPDEEHEEPAHQIAITDAAERDPELEIGDVVEEPLEPVDFGRIGAQAAKQVIVQKIRDAEREQILNDFLERKDNLLTGTVKRIERGNVIIESGRIEGMIARDHGGSGPPVSQPLAVAGHENCKAADQIQNGKRVDDAQQVAHDDRAHTQRAAINANHAEAKEHLAKAGAVQAFRNGVVGQPQQDEPGPGDGGDGRVLGEAGSTGR